MSMIDIPAALGSPVKRMIPLRANLPAVTGEERAKNYLDKKKFKKKTRYVCECQNERERELM